MNIMVYHSSMMGACQALGATFYFMGEFEAARQHAMRGVQLWRTEGVRSLVEEVSAPAVICLRYQALCEWHFASAGRPAKACE